MSASGSRESSPELARVMGAVARDLLGEPNEPLSTEDELRFGTRGSLSVNLKAGTFFDHEAGVGGGVLDFVMRERHIDKEGALAWLRHHKHLAEPRKLNIVARYPYTDPDGGLLYEVVRLDPKDFPVLCSSRHKRAVHLIPTSINPRLCTLLTELCTARLVRPLRTIGGR